MKKIYLFSGPGTTEGFSKKILEELSIDLKDAKSITFIASSPTNHDKNLKFIYGSEKITGMINHLKLIHTFEQINVIDDLNKNKNTIIAKTIHFKTFTDTFSFILSITLSIIGFIFRIKITVKTPQNIEYSKHILPFTLSIFLE